MFATIGHTFELMKMSWNVLMQDRELILFPVLSGVGLLVLGFAGLAAGIAQSSNLIGFLVMILIAYFITTFFNAALISAALERLRGGDPNVMSGLSHATKHIHHIFLWSVISAIVGTLFRVLQFPNRQLLRPDDLQHDRRCLGIHDLLRHPGHGL